MQHPNSLVVLDFETTGLSPEQGDRAIEIGAVRIVDGQVTEHFQQLMNPGFSISAFIADYTGISNSMLADAPPCAQVMSEFAHFIGDDNLVAHNASFDRRFLDAEFRRLGVSYNGQFACSLLLARRLLQQAPNHKLGTLVNYLSFDIDSGGDGQFHRALFDAQMAAKLWLYMIEYLEEVRGLKVTFDLLQRLAKIPKSRIEPFIQKLID